MTLRMGEQFPSLTVQTVNRGAMTIPQDVDGANKVILFYRGGW